MCSVYVLRACSLVLCACVCSVSVYVNILGVSASPLAENLCPVPTNLTSSSFVSSKMLCFY